MSDDYALQGENLDSKRIAPKRERLMSLDAYRGLIMILLASSGFGLVKAAELFQPTYALAISYQLSHPQWYSNTWWIGCSLWDLIQPSFMFMVGVSMAYSRASRKARGQSAFRMGVHALLRSIILILLGVFLASKNMGQTDWVFFNVLCQIGLGYFFVFLLVERGLVIQVLAVVVILVGYWGAFFIASEPSRPHPSPQEEIPTHWIVPMTGDDLVLEGMPTQWINVDMFQRWAKNDNLASEFDRWLLNQPIFARTKPFKENPGGYTTLNFVPSMATMLLGVIAGQLLLGPRRRFTKFLFLVLAGILCMAVALVAGHTICPIVKRVWTPSWALFSGAWTLWILATFYFIIDICRLRWWSLILVVVGTNSLLMYMMGQLMRTWTAKMIQIHANWVIAACDLKLEHGIFQGPYGPIIQACSVLAVFWLTCLWLYRQKAFLRI